VSQTYRDFTLHRTGASGDERTRTADPLLAKQVLFRLSYVPLIVEDLGVYQTHPKNILSTALVEHMLAGENEGGYRVSSVGDVELLVKSFERYLRAENKSARTVQTYGGDSRPVRGVCGHGWPNNR
jgi:hypothetical protein